MMKRALSMLAAGLFALGLQAQTPCGPYQFRNFSIKDTAAAKGWPGDTFALSQAYPSSAPGAPAWEKTDPAKEGGEKYSRTLLNYCWEGQEEVSFRSQDNKVRRWYHSPWLDFGVFGREFLHGLRREGAVKAKSFGDGQNADANVYSLTLFNDVAGYTLGQVWCDPAKPDTAKAKFNNGAVILKLLFTTASPIEAPALKGSMEWEANVLPDAANLLGERKTSKVRLFQVDITAKSSKSPSGWVFLSYLFKGDAPGATLRDKILTAGVSTDGKALADSSKYLFYNGKNGKPFLGGLGAGNPLYGVHLGYMNLRLSNNQALPMEASSLLSEGEGFELNNAAPEEENAEPEIKIDEGLTGNNLMKFIVFGTLIMAFIGLLVWNIFKK